VSDKKAKPKSTSKTKAKPKSNVQADTTSQKVPVGPTSPPTHNQPQSIDEAAMLKRILHSPSYLRADQDIEFLNLDSMRPVRMQLELLKPEMTLEAAGVTSTIALFGSARIEDHAKSAQRVAAAEAALAADPTSKLAKRELARMKRLASLSHYYDEAREFARIVSSTCQIQGKCDFVILTGGGPGIMEAGNRGAHDVGAKSIGLNITLPHEQFPNPYIAPELCFQFRYFAIRKIHFLLRAQALVVFPGGYGTLDELFETLTLRQTGKLKPIPIIMYGRKYWEQAFNPQFLADEGTISDEDLNLIQYSDDPTEAWDIIQRYYREAGELAEKTLK
jgi:uncharacterized protein (TIGR00730 family)